ncbi:ras GTPase-activating-like protein IQGAP2 [Lithobates pipiens]
MTTLQKRQTSLCRRLDIFSNEGISSWLTSFFQREDDKVQSPTDQNSNISSNEGFSSWLGSFIQREDDKLPSPTYQNSDISSNKGFGSWLSSFFQRDDKTENKDDKFESVELEEQRRGQAIVKLQSLIRGYVAKKHYKSLMKDENPPLRAIRYFSWLLDPVDPSFVQQVQRNALRDEFASKLKTIYEQEEEVKSLENGIASLVKHKIAQQDLLSKYKKLTSKNKNRIKEVIAAERQAVCETIKNRERVSSYKHLFYYLQTNPTYLTRLIGQMSDPHDMTMIVDRLLHSLYNYASTPQKEYFFVKLMEATLCKEVDRRLDAIEDLVNGKSMILELIVKFYTHQANYNGLVKALTPAIREILSITYDLTTSPNLPSNRNKKKIILMERILGLTTPETPAKFDGFSIYNMADKLLESIVSSVNSIPYGLRYLTKVVQKSLQTKFPKESEDVLLRTVSQFLFQYLQPAIERPDLFGLIAPEVYPGSVQRENLMGVSRIIYETMQCFAVKIMYDPESHINICRPFPRFRSFFQNVLNVPEPEGKFNFNKFFEIPVVKMPAEDIIYTHSLLSRYEDFVFCDPMDIACQVFKDIGPVPHVNDLLATDAAEYDETEKRFKICLYLSSKFPQLQDFNTEMDNLMIATKKLALDVIRLVPGETLQDVLMAPISLAQEEQHRNLIEGTSFTRNNYPQDITVSCLMKDHDLSLQSKCYKVSANLNTLQKVCASSEVRNHQDFLNLIAREIKEKHILCLERESETRTIQETLAVLCNMSDYMQRLKDLNKRYWVKCVDNILYRKTFPGDEIRKVPFEDDEVITYTSKKLLRKGVIMDTWGEFKQLKDEVICIKLAGDVFNISLGIKHVLLPVVDVLRLHHSSKPMLKLFHYDVDVGMFLFLVTKLFEQKHNPLHSFLNGSLLGTEKRTVGGESIKVGGGEKREGRGKMGRGERRVK